MDRSGVSPLSKQTNISEAAANKPHPGTISTLKVSDQESGPLTTFPRFLDLPKELRELVYHHAGIPLLLRLAADQGYAYYLDYERHTRLLRTSRFVNCELEAYARLGRLTQPPVIVSSFWYPEQGEYLHDKLSSIYSHDLEHLKKCTTDGRDPSNQIVDQAIDDLSQDYKRLLPIRRTFSPRDISNEMKLLTDFLRVSVLRLRRKPWVVHRFLVAEKNVAYFIRQGPSTYLDENHDWMDKSTGLTENRIRDTLAELLKKARMGVEAKLKYKIVVVNSSRHREEYVKSLLPIGENTEVLLWDLASTKELGMRMFGRKLLPRTVTRHGD